MAHKMTSAQGLSWREGTDIDGVGMDGYAAAIRVIEEVAFSECCYQKN
jgi:hypothetical protein